MISLNESDINSLKPLSDRVLVRKQEGAKRTASGIVLPEASTEDVSLGTVVSVGEGSTNEKGEKIAIPLKEGNKILFGQWSGTKVSVANVTYILIKWADILAVIEN